MSGACVQQQAGSYPACNSRHAAYRPGLPATHQLLGHRAHVLHQLSQQVGPQQQQARPQARHQVGQRLRAAAAWRPKREGRALATAAAPTAGDGAGGSISCNKACRALRQPPCRLQAVKRSPLAAPPALRRSARRSSPPPCAPPAPPWVGGRGGERGSPGMAVAGAPAAAPGHGERACERARLCLPFAGRGQL